MAKRTCQRCDAGGGVFAGRDADGGIPLTGFALDLLAGLRVNDGISIAPLTRDWREIAGERLAGHTRPGRVERPTFGSVDQRSIQLSYGRVASLLL